jgi:hypothetical protein
MRGWLEEPTMTALKKPNKKRKGYWKSYEKANIKDYRKVWNISKQIVKEEELPFKPSKRGRPPKLPLWMYPCLAILYVYFDDPFRGTEQLLTLLTGKTLDHSNIIRWFGKLNPDYIDKLVYNVHAEVIKQSDKGDYIADSSGVTCDRYRETVSRGQTIRELIDWKLHIFVQYLFVLGLVSIVSVWPTHGDGGDSPAYRDHLLKPERVKKNRKCHADKAYFGKENIEKTKEAKLIPNFVPKEIRYTDSMLKKAVKEYDNEARKKNRGLVETPFGGLETEMHMKIRCRKAHHRDIATSLLALKHNIKTLLRAKALNLRCYFAPTSSKQKSL